MRRRLSRLFESIWYGSNPLAIVLLPISWLYRLLFWLHRKWRLRARQKFEVPVIVVGNITIGGTGKTPMIIWLTRELRERGYSVGVISRGYLGAKNGSPARVYADSDPAIVGDEAVLIARRAACPVVVCADRNAALECLLEGEAIDVVLSDDGLQHHALARDFEIALVDGYRGLGNGYCLPAGPLREAASRLNSVDAIVVNGAPWTYPGAVHTFVRVSTFEQLSDGRQSTLAEFDTAKVHAVAAIGNPQRFFDLLEKAGLVVIPHQHADHARLEMDDLDFADGFPVLLTEKDAVKCETFAPAGVWSVNIDLAFEESEARILMERLLSNLHSEN